MKRILLTGGTGFVGRAICEKISSEKRFNVLVAVRKRQSDLPETIRQEVIGGIDLVSNWSDLLEGVEVVIHAAARVHVMAENSKDSLEEFRKINVSSTGNLARQAAKAGVKRFIFLSSIKVNGEKTLPGSPFTEEDLPDPQEPYAISKYEAELALQQLSRETGMEVVIIRPPLVYGPGVKANFRSMMHWLYKGIPLPLGAVVNKRSLLALDNLVDFIVTCVDHAAAANQTFLISDGEDLSTTELLRRMSKALGKSIWLLPVPVNLLLFLARRVGKYGAIQRLCRSLQVDGGKAHELLGWEPPISASEGLRRTAEAYLIELSKHTSSEGE